MTYLAIAATAIAALPLTAHAQGFRYYDYYDEERAARQADAILDAQDWPRFREYVVREHRPSYRFGDEVRVGTVLPERGITFYDVPREYRIRPGYRYAVVNERAVIVEPRSRRIVEIIDIDRE
jgi:hypothetical protein